MTRVFDAVTAAIANANVHLTSAEMDGAKITITLTGPQWREFTQSPATSNTAVLQGIGNRMSYMGHTVRVALDKS